MRARIEVIGRLDDLLKELGSVVRKTRSELAQATESGAVSRFVDEHRRKSIERELRSAIEQLGVFRTELSESQPRLIRAFLPWQVPEGAATIDEIREAAYDMRRKHEHERETRTKVRR